MTGLATTRDWESDLRSWGKPPGTTEEQRCANAVSAVRNAINKSVSLRGHSILVFAQGSYRNGTSVRRDSDVDVCVCSAFGSWFWGNVGASHPQAARTLSYG